jgi:hypothetical protein
MMLSLDNVLDITCAGVSGALGTLLLASAIAKAFAFDTTTAALAGYALVWSRAARPLAVALVVIEAAIALALLSGHLALLGGLAAAAFFACAAIVVGISLGLGRVPTSCGCFGAIQERVSATTVVRAALLVLHPGNGSTTVDLLQDGLD